MGNVVKMANKLAAEIDRMKGTDSKIEALNTVREILHGSSPMKAHPVDLVLWRPAEMVVANDYNPNELAKPEMVLLTRSIEADGFTQPIVVYPEDTQATVVDGFHRHLVGKAIPALSGYLPTTTIRASVSGRSERMASTIRHNRARGQHAVDGMVSVVRDLARKNWSNKKIGRELGMDEDEVLRLRQISGLADLFSDEEFSQAWDPAD